MVQLIVQADAAADTVHELGEVGCLMFVDLNDGVSAFKRHFMSDIRRCDEMGRSLRYICEQVEGAGLQPRRAEGDELAEGEPRGGASPAELQALLVEHERELRGLRTSTNEMEANLSRLVELSHVLYKCEDIFAQAKATESSVVPRSLSTASMAAQDGTAVPSPGIWSSASLDEVARRTHTSYEECGAFSDDAPLLDAHPSLDIETGATTSDQPTRLGYISGVIDRSKLQPFERVLFRATRGNMYLRAADIGAAVRDPLSGELAFKSVFLVFFSGLRSQDKVAKIADSFGANRYNYPSRYVQRNALLSEVLSRIADMRTVLARMSDRTARMLERMARSLSSWQQRVAKQRAVYLVLNMWNYDLTRKVLIAEAWCPVSLVDETTAALRRGTARSGAQVPSIMNLIDTDEKPPTYFKLNKFTQGFHALVEAYGVPRYGEINPSAFAIVTFPFLFGIMFGDIGHGTLVTLFALYFIANERKFEAMHSMDEILAYAWHGRYVLLLMGLFSVYAGLLYNDVFGLMADLFGSTWLWTEGTREKTRATPDAVYPFGLDPGWHHATNELSFGNSYKMKLSIVFGVLQMLLGLVLSLINSLHFRSALDVWCEFVPQAIFMLSIFGYLVFAIFFKWSVDWVDEGLPAPSLIAMLIAFFMQPGRVLPEANLFRGQATVQLILLALAAVSVPWMLLAKPLLLRRQHMQVSGYKTLRSRESTDEASRRLIDDSSSVDRFSDSSSDKNGKYHQDEFDFAEVVVHQVIHSIEYVLGCISNTASYLRLWALSLAHKQLSVVFWEMIIVGAGLDFCKAASALSCAVPLALAFCAWAVATVMILCCMELLSAFLHTLRLHWVEFQNKFYKGDGRKFVPFSFADELLRGGGE